jgi:beta-1,4-mannosyltransferase
MQVFMMPDYRADNPYQSLLTTALQQQGATITFPVGYRRIFPIYRAIKANSTKINLLHLHWLDPYLKGDNVFVKLIYCTKFLLDIALVRLSGVKVVWTVHNLVAHNAKYPRLERWTQTLLTRLVNYCIVHSQSSCQAIAQRHHLTPNKIAIIPHGHYREVYAPAIDPIEARQALNLPTAGRLYLNLGMLKPYKGIEQLIQLWQEHDLVLGDSTLLIAGKAIDDNFGKALEAQVSNSDTITLQNTFIDNSQIHLYLSAADVVILPFQSIFTSGSLILAMSYGKPIIAPKIGSIPETVGAADWLLYDPNTESSLLYAMKACMQTDLHKLGQLTHHVCDGLNWEIIGEKTHHLYQTVL